MWLPRKYQIVNRNSSLFQISDEKGITYQSALSSLGQTAINFVGNAVQALT